MSKRWRFVVAFSSKTLLFQEKCTQHAANLDALCAQEVGRGMQHVGSVRGVVVGVGGMVAGLDELQPRAQRGLCAVQELAHAESGKDLQPEVGQGPAGNRTEEKDLLYLIVC